MTHPTEHELALFAGNDGPALRGFLLARHLRRCETCAQTVAEFREITRVLTDSAPVVADWDRLAIEMQANIRLGLEAGACVRQTSPVPAPGWNPRLALAMASLAILAVAGIALRRPAPRPDTSLVAQQSVKVDSEGVTITSVFME